MKNIVASTTGRTTASKTIRKVLLLCLLSLPLLSALAEETLPEILVTADYRSTNELDAPTSVSVITDEVVSSRAAQHFEDVIAVLPNVNYAAGSNRARFFQIRGIGERSQFVTPLNSSVGFIIDNVDYSGAATSATLMDVEQIEVLRGPQGTRYGANALAGLINIKTRDPSEEFAAGVKLGSAEYGTSTVGAFATGPLGARAQYRLAAERHRTNGYYENDFLGKDDTNGRDEFTLRGKLSVQAGDAWDLLISVNAIDIDNGYDAFNLDNTRHTISDEPGFDRQDSLGLSIDSVWHFESVDFELIAGHMDAESGYGYDEDWTYTGFHPWAYKSTDVYLRDRQTDSLEARLVSTPDNRIFNESTDWLIGTYLLRSEEDLRRAYTFQPADFLSSHKFDTYAVFLQLDSTLSDAVVLEAGLRFERRDTSYQDSEGVAFTPDENMWGGRIALTYSLHASSMSYVSLARGYKAGGFNTDGSLDADLREFDEESLVELELGIKSRFADDTFQMRLAAFYDQRRNQQVKSSLVRSRADGSSEFVDYLGNAAEGTNAGIEVEANWYVTDNFRLTTTLGLLEAEFDDFINEFGEDLSGRDQAHAPGRTYHVSADYLRGGFHFNLSMDGKDEFYFSDRHNVKSESYSVVNASLAYRTDRWGIQLWGRNLNDKAYYTRAFGSFSNDPRDFYEFAEPYYQFGEPRIAGVTIDFSFN
jgi:iron complex outermembrane recepter protein